MQQYRVNISAPNLMNICIDDNSNGELSGRLYHCYSKEPIHFLNVVHLIMEMEDLCDAIRFPQASTKTRTFVKETPVSTTVPVKVAEQKDILGFRGERGTFITHIKFRQNATWQGECLWVEEDETFRFRDTFSFLKTIDKICHQR